MPRTMVHGGSHWVRASDAPSGGDGPHAPHPEGTHFNVPQKSSRQSPPGVQPTSVVNTNRLLARDNRNRQSSPSGSNVATSGSQQPSRRRRGPRGNRGEGRTYANNNNNNDTRRNFSNDNNDGERKVSTNRIPRAESARPELSPSRQSNRIVEGDRQRPQTAPQQDNNNGSGGQRRQRRRGRRPETQQAGEGANQSRPSDNPNAGTQRRQRDDRQVELSQVRRQRRQRQPNDATAPPFGEDGNRAADLAEAVQLREIEKIDQQGGSLAQGRERRGGRRQGAGRQEGTAGGERQRQGGRQLQDAGNNNNTRNERPQGNRLKSREAPLNGDQNQTTEARPQQDNQSPEGEQQRRRGGRRGRRRPQQEGVSNNEEPTQASENAPAERAEGGASAAENNENSQRRRQGRQGDRRVESNNNNNQKGAQQREGEEAPLNERPAQPQDNNQQAEGPPQWLSESGRRRWRRKAAGQRQQRRSEGEGNAEQRGENDAQREQEGDKRGERREVRREDRRGQDRRNRGEKLPRPQQTTEGSDLPTEGKAPESASRHDPTTGAAEGEVRERRGRRRGGRRQKTDDAQREAELRETDRVGPQQPIVEGAEGQVKDGEEKQRRGSRRGNRRDRNERRNGGEAKAEKGEEETSAEAGAEGDKVVEGEKQASPTVSLNVGEIAPAPGAIEDTPLPRRRRERRYNDEGDEMGVDGKALPRSGSLIDAEAPKHEKKYEFKDHTADIQVHSWGDNLNEAFEQAVIGMWAYMTELDKVEIDPECTFEVTAEGNGDMESLLFAFMDEFLYKMSSDYIIGKEVQILDFDRENFKIRARGWGEKWVMGKHPQGTEVKAITYSNMKIWEQEDGTAETYVIIDI